MVQRATFHREAPVLSCAWNRDGTHVVSGGCDHKVVVRDLQLASSIPSFSNSRIFDYHPQLGTSCIELILETEADAAGYGAGLPQCSNQICLNLGGPEPHCLWQLGQNITVLEPAAAAACEHSATTRSCLCHGHKVPTDGSGPC